MPLKAIIIRAFYREIFAVSAINPSTQPSGTERNSSQTGTQVHRICRVNHSKNPRGSQGSRERRKLNFYILTGSY